MKRIVTMGLAVILMMVISFTFTGCERKEWWEDGAKINVEFSDPLATPETRTINLKDSDARKNIHFTYIFDGNEHFPEARMIVGSEEKGYVLREQKMIYLEDEGRYNTIPWIIYPGKYMMTYEMYKTQDTSDHWPFTTLIIKIEILKNE